MARHRPLTLFAVLLGTAMLVESVIHLLAPLELPAGEPFTALVAGLLLAVMLFAPLYFLFYRPLQLHHTTTRQALTRLEEESSQRREAERLLQQSERELHSITHTATDAIICANAQGEVIYWNPSASRIFGYTAEEMMGRSLHCLIPPQYRERHDRGMARVAASGQAPLAGRTVELSGLRQDGSEFPLELSLSTWRQNNQPHFSAVIRDITERKRAEAQVLEEKARAQRYLAIAGTIIVALDTRGRISLINRRGESVLGYDTGELEGRYWIDEVVPEEERPVFRQVFQGIVDGSSPAYDRFENEVVTKGGERRIISWCNTVLRDEAGNVTGTLSSGEDVTHQRELEERNERVHQSRIAISQLLRVTLQPMSQAELIQASLEIILQVPWVAVKSKGAIFLVDEGSGHLVMTAQKGLADHLLTACARVESGYCLCGRAAATRELLFASDLDERHDITYEGIQPHGHYCVPILSRGRLLGVINLYLPAAHREDEEEKVMLSSIADTLAGVIERQRMEEKLTRLAHHDTLTGLPNRAMFLEHMDRLLATARRNRSPLAVMFLDLDRFKPVNDTLGHEVGDRLLKGVAERLRGALREADLVARLGGDEFTIALPQIAHPDDAALVAEKLLQTIAQPFPLGEHTCTIGVSIGISLFPDHGEDPETLLRKADLALYAVKEAGRNAYRFHEPAAGPP